MTILAILASIGALTGIGVAGAVFLFGIPLASLLANVVGLLREAVNFLKTPVGQVVSIIALCALCVLGGESFGEYRANAQCRAADEAAQLAAVKRDAAIKQLAVEMVRKQVDAIETERRALAQKVADYEKELTGKKACALDATDVKRLRRIVR